MKRILLKLTIVLILSIAGGSTAQNNAQPDSLHGKTSVRLQLPDEIIYGKNRAKRIISKSKADFDAGLQLLKPEINLKPQFVESFSNKIYYLQFNRLKNRGVNLSLRGGSYSDLEIKAGIYQQSRKFNFQVLGSFNNFKGQYENSHSRKIFARTFLSSQMSQNLSTAIAVNGTFQEYGLFKAHNLNSISRTINHIESDFYLKYSYDSNYFVNTRVFYNGVDFSENRDEQENFKDNWFGFNVNYQKKLNSAKILGEAGYHHNDFAQKQTQTEFFTKAGISLIPIKNLQLSAKVGYQDVSVSGQSGQNKFFPEIELNFTPSMHLAARLLIHSEILPIKFNSLAWINPFLALNDSLIPINRKFRSLLSVNFMPENAFLFGLMFSYEKRENDIYWFKNTSTNLFQLHRFGSTSRIDLSINAKVHFSEKFSIDGKFQMKFYSISDDSLKDENAHFPYVEKFSFPLILSWNFISDFNANFKLTYMGSRYLEVNGKDQLSDYLFASATITKPIMKKFSAYLQTKNLFNQKIEIWNGFPETGISFIIGVMGKW